MTELRLLLSIVTAVTGLSGKGGQFLVYSSQQTHTSAQGLSFWCLAGLSAVLARPLSPGVTYTQIPRNVLGFNYYPNYHLPPKLRSWKITSAISLCLRHLLSLPERLTVSTQSTSASISHPAPNCSRAQILGFPRALWGWASLTHSSFSSLRSSLPWSYIHRGDTAGLNLLQRPPTLFTL